MAWPKGPPLSYEPLHGSPGTSGWLVPEVFANATGDLLVYVLDVTG